MKKSLLMFLFFWVLFLGGDSFQTQAKKKTKDSYKLVFCDEFNLSDGAQPDTAIWSRCQRYNSQWNRWVSDSKDVIYIKRGKLVCRAIPNSNEKGDTAKMLTGAIWTRNKYAFQYGRLLVRMKRVNMVLNLRCGKTDPSSSGHARL